MNKISKVERHVRFGLLLSIGWALVSGVEAEVEVSRAEVTADVLATNCYRFMRKFPNQRITQWSDFESLIRPEKIKELSQQYGFTSRAVSLPSRSETEIFLVHLTPFRLPGSKVASRALIYMKTDSQFGYDLMAEEKFLEFIQLNNLEIVRAEYSIPELTTTGNSQSSSPPLVELEKKPTPPSPTENPTPPAEAPEAKAPNSLLYVLLGLLVIAVAIVALRKARNRFDPRA